MPTLKKLTDLNIQILPPKTDLGETDQHIAFGDLHGNAMKLIHQLVVTGFINNLSHAQYNNLYKIYATPAESLTNDQIERFQWIIDSLEFNHQRSLTLIGDELADRGMNDYFSLLIMQKMQVAGIQFDVTVSNHSLEFIRNAEGSKVEQLSNDHDQKKSYMNYETLRFRFPNVAQKADAIVDKVYKKRVKVVSYTYDAKNDQLIIYSHAPINLEVLKRLCLQFGVKPQFETNTDIAKSLDALNAEFQRRFELNTLHEVTGKEYLLSIGLKYQDDQNFTKTLRSNITGSEDKSIAIMNANRGGKELLSCINPLQLLIWNRRYFVSEGNSPNIQFVHGHTGPVVDPYSTSHTCIDNDFGKPHNDKSDALFSTAVSDPLGLIQIMEISVDGQIQTEKDFLSDYLGAEHHLVRSIQALDNSADTLRTLRTCRDTLFKISRMIDSSDVFIRIINNIKKAENLAALQDIELRLKRSHLKLKIQSAPDELSIICKPLCRQLAELETVELYKDRLTMLDETEKQIDLLPQILSGIKKIREKQASRIAADLMQELTSLLNVNGDNKIEALQKMQEKIKMINHRIVPIQSQIDRLKRYTFTGGSKRRAIEEALRSTTLDQLMADPNTSSPDNKLFNALKIQRNWIPSKEAKAFSEYKSAIKARFSNTGEEPTKEPCATPSSK